MIKKLKPPVSLPITEAKNYLSPYPEMEIPRAFTAFRQAAAAVVGVFTAAAVAHHFITASPAETPAPVPPALHIAAP